MVLLHVLEHSQDHGHHPVEGANGKSVYNMPKGVYVSGVLEPEFEVHLVVVVQQVKELEDFVPVQPLFVIFPEGSHKFSDIGMEIDMEQFEQLH